MIPSVLTFCSDQALGDRVAETENSSLSLKAQKILWRRLGEGLGAWPFPFEMTLWIKCDSKHAVLCHLLLQEALHIYMQSAFWVTGPASCVCPISRWHSGRCSVGLYVGLRCTWRGSGGLSCFSSWFWLLSYISPGSQTALGINKSLDYKVQPLSENMMRGNKLLKAGAFQTFLVFCFCGKQQILPSSFGKSGKNLLKKFFLMKDYEMDCKDILYFIGLYF